jgi:hypothetical protein
MSPINQARSLEQKTEFYLENKKPNRAFAGTLFFQTVVRVLVFFRFHHV